jgi:non-heme chloroperoxidase
MDRGEGGQPQPDRGPMLIISGELDHTVPVAISEATYEKQSRNPGVTELVEMPGRGHSLTIDSGWLEIAETALAFVQRCDQDARPPRVASRS